MRRLSALIIVFLLCLAAGSVYAASLSIDTDYRLRGVSYPNTDFDKNSSSEAVSYYSHRYKLAVKGYFVPDIEIGAQLTAIGVDSYNVPEQAGIVRRMPAAGT